MGLLSSFQEYDDSLAKKPEELSGILGIRLNGERVVEHATRNGFVYVRLRDNLSEVIQAFNDKVSPVYDLPVKVQRRNNKWYIVGRDVDRYSNWGSSSPFLPKHGFQHSFNRDLGTGGDVVEVYSDQFMPALVFPSGTNGAGMLMTAPLLLQRTSDFVFTGNTGTVNLLPYKPTGTSAVMGLVYLDRVTGNPGILINSGSHASGVQTGTSEVAPYIPYPASVNQEPLYAFRLVSGTESLLWENLYNARQFLAGRSSSSASSGGLGGTGTITGDRVVVTDHSGTITTDPSLVYDVDKDLLVLGDQSIFPSPLGTGSIHLVQNGLSPSIFAATYGSASVAPFLSFGKVRGTPTGISALLDDDVIGRIRARAHDGGAFSNTQGEIRAVAGGNWAVGAHPLDWEFYVTPTGSTILTLLGTMRNDSVLWMHSGSRVSADNGLGFQRIMERPLVLENGESLIVPSYINMNGYDIVMSGDSELRLI